MVKRIKESTAPLKGVLSVVGIGIVVIIFAWLFLFQIAPGYIGLISTFGTIEDGTYSSGIHLKMPWQNVITMDTRTIELKETASTPTDQGLTVTLETSILYHIDASKAPEIYKNIGPEYERIVIESNFRSVVRGVTASYDAKALYTSDREAVAGKIFNDLEPALMAKGVVLEKVLLREITLPANVREGIEAKLVADQDAQRMEYVLQKEQKEAERKIIEAGGIAESQKIIDNSLTEQYLKWYWVSSLGKYDAIAYIPIANDGMPLFKDVDNLGTENGWGNTNVNKTE